MAVAMKPPFKIDISGRRFGSTTVVHFQSRDPRKPSEMLWLCRCDCGVEHLARASNLKAGNTKSCGHLHSGGRAVEWHGQRDSLTYSSWEHMLTRGRGKSKGRHAAIYAHVTVCDRWCSYTNFAADMGERPSQKHSIDRIDPNKGYEPSNCRWATAKEQNRNLRTVRRVEYEGEMVSEAELAERFGLRRDALKRRIDGGWPVWLAVCAPPGSYLRDICQ